MDKIDKLFVILIIISFFILMITNSITMLWVIVFLYLSLIIRTIINLE